ncbi:sulfurtransferase TusA family protein [Radiobacillus kanasensis]|uniref:sulfurtransferase TusA family protein n=1 Tax=Radiobacillus kanasensis TaxID=2844358 RepID=UPI001E35BCED|nr:sulfurtransferase TusA family protein [Radiobacillus kanasensis]UFT98394.1 sulfurtransferase TusA family protein [Radiobacillus kanasensis]
MEQLKANLILDAKGLACPMPIVKTKKAMKDLEAGRVMEVQATDVGSRADLKAWAQSAGHHYLGTIEDGNILRHFLRKSSTDDAVERNHPNVATNEELLKKMEGGENITILDVRETAEYAFEHIAEAICIPFEELEDRLSELDKERSIYVVCRTGNRSDLAAQQLEKQGFLNVVNVVPGMSGWTGKTTGLAE